MALNLKMVKTDSLAVPGSNQERRWDDRSCRKTGSVTLISGSVTVISGHERLGRTVTKPDRRRRKVLKQFFVSSAPFTKAALLRERAVSCFSNHPQLACWDSMVVAWKSTGSGRDSCS
jgi:hypothetical protein